MKSELKPCPFCGSARATVTSECDMDTDGKFYRIECLDCKAKTKEHYAVETCPIFYESVRNDWNTRASPSVCSHPCNTKDVECQKIQNLEHKTELENIIQDAVNKTLAQPKYRRGQYIIEDSELQKYATPSADTLAGLVRYDLDHVSKYTGSMTERLNGKYVLYSEAAAVIAAKDAEIERLKPYETELLSLAETVGEEKDPFAAWETIEPALERAEAAEAELAQIKAQAPVAILKYDRSAGNENEMPKIISCKWLADGEYPLYASPVSDSLKAENERLRLRIKLLEDAAKPFAMEPLPIYTDDQYPQMANPNAGSYRRLIAALNVEASPLAPEGGRE